MTSVVSIPLTVNFKLCPSELRHFARLHDMYQLLQALSHKINALVLVPVKGTSNYITGIRPFLKTLRDAENKLSLETVFASAAVLGVFSMLVLVSKLLALAARCSDSRGGKTRSAPCSSRLLVLSQLGLKHFLALGHFRNW